MPGSSAVGIAGRAAEDEVRDQPRRPGPVEIPHGPWPAATNARSIHGIAPRSGRPSGLTRAGRNVRTPTSGAAASAGT